MAKDFRGAAAGAIKFGLANEAVEKQSNKLSKSWEELKTKLSELFGPAG